MKEKYWLKKPIFSNKLKAKMLDLKHLFK